MATLKMSGGIAVQPRLPVIDAASLVTRVMPILQRMDELAREVQRIDRKLSRIQSMFDDDELRERMADDDDFWAEGRQRQRQLLTQRNHAVHQMEGSSSAAMAVWRQGDDAARSEATRRITRMSRDWELWSVLGEIPTISRIHPWPDLIFWGLEEGDRCVPF